MVSYKALNTAIALLVAMITMTTITTKLLKELWADRPLPTRPFLNVKFLIILCFKILYYLIHIQELPSHFYDCSGNSVTISTAFENAIIGGSFTPLLLKYFTIFLNFILIH